MAQPVFPHKPYLVIVGIVDLEVIYNNEIEYGKTPDIAFPGTIRLGLVDLIDPLVVGLAIVEKAIRIICVGILVLTEQYIQRVVYAGFVDTVDVNPEIHIMLVGIAA